MTHGRYHPVMQAKLVGGFDKDNNLTALHIRLSGQSILASVFPQNLQQGMDPLTFQGLMRQGQEHAFSYTIDNLLIDHSMRNPHILPGFWRGVNINQNCIFIECFMDELAQAAGQDELEFRRKLLGKHPRNLAVLNAAAERIGWSTPAPSGIYRGLAHLKAFNAYVAAAAEISVERGGNKIKIHRLVAATDPTFAVNPAQIDRQAAGSFVYGPRNVPHTFIVGSAQARFLLVTEPGGFELFMRSLSEPAQTRTIPPPAATPPDPAPLVAAAAEYGIEILGPPGIPT